MQHLENGDWKTLRDHKDWGENHSKDHRGHEVKRNLSETSDQTLMHIDVYAENLSTISPQTPSRALRALLTRGGGKSIRADSR